MLEKGELQKVKLQYRRTGGVTAGWTDRETPDIFYYIKM